jgi:hypothetical protein
MRAMVFERVGSPLRAVEREAPTPQAARGAFSGAAVLVP